MYYRPLLKKALEITIRNKFLWIFGVFAAFLGNGGVYDILWQGWKYITSSTSVAITRFSTLSFEESGWAASYSQMPWVIIGAAIIIFILGAGFIFLVVSSQGSLIFATQKLAANRKVDFKTAWKEGVAKFVKLFSFHLFGKILIFVLLFLASVPVFLKVGGEGSLGWIFSFISFLVFVPLALMVSFSIIYGATSIMIKNVGFREAFHKSLDLFKKYWLESLEFALLLLALNVFVALALALLFIFLFLPFLALGTGFFFIFGTMGLWINITIFILLCLIIFALVGSVFGAFQVVAWTLFYLQITKGDFISKITRILGAVFKR